MRAKSVNFLKTGGRVGIGIWLLLAALLTLPLLALLWIPIPWWLGAGAIVVLFQLASADLILDHRLSRALFAFVTQ